MHKETNQIKWGAVLSYVQMALSIIIGLLYTPVMIRLLGKSEYGLYNTVSSTISMLTILSLGFNSSYIRYYSKYKKEGDEKAIYKLNGLFLIVFGIIGLVALVCGLFLSFNLQYVFKEGLTSQEYATAKVLMLLLTINLTISFPANLFTSIISAHEKYIFLKLLGMLKTIIGPLVTLPLLLLGYRSIAMVTITVSVSLITDILYFIYVKTVLKNRFVFHGFEKGIFKRLFVYTSFIAINLIVDQINWNMGKFLLGRFKGTEVVAVYSVGYSLYNYYAMFSSAISGIFVPRTHKIVNATANDVVKQKQELTDIFVKVGRMQFLLLGLLASGLVFFGKPFISFWAGTGYGDAYYVMILLVIPASIALIQNIGIEVQRAKNKHQFRSLIYLIMALINLVLSIFLCQRYGAIGSAIGTAISLVVANGLIMNIYYHKKCNIDIICFWKNILRMSIGLIVPIVFAIIIVNMVNLYNIGHLIIFICLYTIVYCISMWFTGMNKYERTLIQKPIKIVLRRAHDKNS